MLISAAFDDFFLKTLAALQPYHEDIVCIGGCANALYRYHPAASSSLAGYLGTEDIDIAVPERVPVRGNQTIAGIMEQAGLREETFGTDREPVVKYVPRHGDFTGDIEFLCNASGLRGGRERRGTPVSYEVQAGLMAQPLRYLAILLRRPWVMSLGDVPGFEAFRSINVRLPNPAAYFAQKVLIQGQRRAPEAMAKDFYYLFEISVLFRDAHKELATEYAALRTEFPRQWFRDFAQRVTANYATRYAEGPVQAARVFNALSEKPEYIVDEQTIFVSVSRLLGGVFGLAVK